MTEFKLKVIMANQPSWRSMSEKLKLYQTIWNRAKNAPKLVIDVEYQQITKPELNKDKNIKPSWMYANIGFAAKKLGYDAVGLIITERDAKKWGMHFARRGQHYRNSNEIGEFWVIADEHTLYKYPKSGLTMNRFLKIFTHEISHMISQHTGQVDVTHHYDYDLEDIAKAYLEYDWHHWSVLSQVRKKYREVLAALQSL